MDRGDDLAHCPFGITPGPVAALPFLSPLARDGVAVELDNSRVAVAALNDAASRDAGPRSARSPWTPEYNRLSGLSTVVIVMPRNSLPSLHTVSAYVLCQLIRLRRGLKGALASVWAAKREDQCFS